MMEPEEDLGQDLLWHVGGTASSQSSRSKEERNNRAHVL